MSHLKKVLITHKEALLTIQILPILRINGLKTGGDFPIGPVIRNPPANAGGRGSISGPGRSHVPRGNEAHVPQLLSLCA